jgi:hypothetical protein
MALGQEKIKEFIEEKTENITNKIERTPMEKFFLFFLILITISALVLGYLQFKANIEGPLSDSYLRELRVNLRAKYGLLNLNTANTNQIDLIKLKNQDSDLDGLDDYSEIYIYHTSPYLADSDSDGISDKDEISQGTDPNCPTGQDCSVTGSQWTVSNNSNSNYNQNLANTNAAKINLPLDNLDSNSLLDLESKLLSGETTLKDLGIDDPQLQNTFDQIRSGQLQSQNLGDLTPEQKSQTLESLKNLTPAEIRQELIKRGLDKSQVDQIDDQTLKSIFLETLNTYQ